MAPVDAPVTSGGTNLIVDGDFSNGGYAWHSDDGVATYTPSGNEGCITIEPGEGFGGLGWPVGTAPANLVFGKSYTLAYTVVAATVLSPSVAIEAIVGPSAPPYSPTDYDHGPNGSPAVAGDPVTTTPTTYTHTFTVTNTAGDPAAGISLQFTGTTGEEVCFSNVSLVQN